MKRGFENYIIPILAIGFMFLFFLMSFSFTGKVIEEPPVPENCSEEEIKKVWESIFEGNSDNLKIDIKYESGEIYTRSKINIFQMTGCHEYEVYQIVGTKVRMLRRSEIFFPGSNEVIIATEVKFKPEKIENFTLFMENLPENASNYFFYINDEEDLSLRDITSVEQAKASFESIFKVNSSDWEYTDEPYWEEYIFVKNKTMKNLTVFGQSINPNGEHSIGGLVIKNITMDNYLYFAGADLGQAKYVSNKFENWTSFINTTVEGIKIKINSSELTITDFLWSIMMGPDYMGIQKVEILQEDKVLVETKINFTEYINFTTIRDKFDWTEIVLKKQPTTSEVGYIIINGINESKNVTIDKLSSESDSVCIKDGEINSISEMSNDCDGTKEYLLDCPGNSNNFTCEIINDTFFVTGLEHSAVLEFLPYEEEVCVSNWNCGLWTDNTNKCGYRDCEDLNDCDNLATTPPEFKECPIICVANWDCTDWEPKKCPKEEERTRTCEDLNDCNSKSNKPNTIQSCERDNKLWLWILLGIFVLLIAIILIISLRSPRRHKPLQEQTHNPHPDDEQHEHEFPDKDQQTYVPEKENNDFQEFKKNKRLQKNPEDNLRESEEVDNFFPAGNNNNKKFKKFP